MRRLHQHQSVELHLDNDDQVIRCRVTSVTGAVATLHRADRSQTSRDDKTPGAVGYLVFQHHGNPIALRGIAAAETDRGSKIDFVVSDGVLLPERRKAERVRIAARARLATRARGDADPGTIETRIADISLTGVLLERRTGMGEATEFTLELFPDGDPTPVRCHARLARRTATHLAMKFIDLPEPDRTRLEIVLDRHRRVGL